MRNQSSGGNQHRYLVGHYPHQKKKEHHVTINNVSEQLTERDREGKIKRSTLWESKQPISQSPAIIKSRTHYRTNLTRPQIVSTLQYLDNSSKKRTKTYNNSNSKVSESSNQNSFE